MSAMNSEIPVPVAVVEVVDRYIADEFRDAAKWSNREVLDDSGAYSLHGVAAEVYARGYQDGRMAEHARANGERGANATERTPRRQREVRSNADLQALW